jgi:outer membrane usher protein
LPFGAEVTDEQGHAVGSVAQSSQLLVRGAEDGGVLTVHWGDAADQQCHIQYSLPPRTKRADSTGFTAVDAVCR